MHVEEAVDVPKSSQFWQVTAKLRGAFVPKRLFSLLTAIAKNPQLVVTERLTVRQRSKKSKFVLIVSAYFQVKK